MTKQLSPAHLSVHDALPALAARGCNTFYMDPRIAGRKGVFSATEALPSPVRRHPGRGPACSYVPSADDAGLASAAYVPTVDEYAQLLSYPYPLPAGTLTQQRLWVANLIMPGMVYYLTWAMMEAGLMSITPAPVEGRGEIVMHDPSAPPPEWLSTDNGLPAAGTSSAFSDHGKTNHS